MKSLNFKRNVIERFLTASFVLAGIVMLVTSCFDSTKKTPLEEGNEFFQSYCVICHGKYADGKGNMADRLNTPPMNLTTIAERRGGVFPDEEIANIIAGKDKVPGHSTGDMPAWWETFKKSEDIKKDKEVQKKIDNIVAYLKAIQKQ